MSRKGGWYDEADDYYDDDDYDDDDDWDDGFGQYDTGSLAKKAPAKGSAAAGKKPPAAAAKGKQPAKATSAMAKQMSATPKEKGVGGAVASRSGSAAPPGFPAKPPSSNPTSFRFDTPSPDDVVLAARGARPAPAGSAPAGPADAGPADADAEAARLSRLAIAPRSLAEYDPPPDESAALSAAARRFHVVVLGHVDAGKSTLMGRVLHAVGAVSQRQAHRNQRDAAAAGKASFSWAWALDERPEERERGVTIDVAQARLETGNTSVTLLDAPGHRDFVPNAIAGAAQADAAILVVDAAPGGFETGFAAGTGAGAGGGQTREHVRLAKSLGVERVVVAVSKMDACGYSRGRFDEIRAALSPFLASCGFGEDRVAWTPVSGTEGVNLALPNAGPNPELAAWWDGPTLVGAIDALPPADRGAPLPLRMPVSDVVAGGGRSLGPAAVGGKIEAGSVRKGQKVLVMPAGVLATVRAVEMSGGAGGDDANSGAARGAEIVGYAGDAVDVGLDGVDPLSLAPGAVLCHPEFPLVPAARMTVRIVTLETVRVPILVGSQVVLHAYSAAVEARVSALVATLDPKTGNVTRERPRCLTRDLSAVVELTPVKPVCVERFDAYKALGRVALRSGGKTVALGVVTETFAE